MSDEPLLSLEMTSEYGSDNDGDKKVTESNRLVKNSDLSNFSEDTEFRASKTWINSDKKAKQSMDFEETESVMWRKVVIPLILLLLFSFVVIKIQFNMKSFS